ncbi:MAG TPA: alginate lyase family protein, partial [Paracoccaceae bacterium]|nr:alginate lyase family protein [Paracoccaceae bacterium]
MRPFLLCAVLALWTAPALAMTPEARAALDLSAFRVTDPDASYFDRAARRAALAATDDPVLAAQITDLSMGVSCRDLRERPRLDATILLPGFYEDNAGWRESAEVFLSFEDAVSALAAAEFVDGGGYHAGCMIDLLGDWAQSGALLDFRYSETERQGWYQIESSLFAAAMAYSVVRDTVPGRAADKARIEDWLVRAARIHLAIPGGTTGTCCNNHFYRRALYAAMIGVLAGQDDLFRVGVSAIYSALSDAEPDGALPLEMARGSRAVHYQNYAVMYLVLIAEVVARQGHDAHAITVDGKRLDLLVDFALSAIEDPTRVDRHTGGVAQDLRQLRDPQYYAWMEPWVARTGDARAERLMAPHRPLYNRSLGGFATLYFHRPTPPDRAPGVLARLFS